MLQGRQDSKRRGSNVNIGKYQKVLIDDKDDDDAGGSSSWRDDGESKEFFEMQTRG